MTSRPSSWWTPGARLFVAEARGARDFSPPDKVAFESVRLVEEVGFEWEWLAIYPEIKALLVSSWRVRFPSKKLPAGADLYRANLSGADLSGANLSGANLYRANLSGANLSGANLSGANLSDADLYRANLYRANLSGANLSGADLSGADLSGADLSGANLSGANLYRANLSGANLSDAKDATLPIGWKVCEDGIAVYGS